MARQIISIVPFIAFICCSIALKPARAAETSPPNFIIISVDDQGCQDLGCYGAEMIKTPRVDRMAAEGIRFTDFYVAAPLCSPSRVALLTGCYPTRIGMGNWGLPPDSNQGIHPDEITLAEPLKTRGYTCGCIGKWHVGFREPCLRGRKGSDSYFGLLHNLDLEADPSEQKIVNRGNQQLIGELRTEIIEFQEDMRRNARPAGESGEVERREGLKA